MTTPRQRRDMRRENIDLWFLVAFVAACTFLTVIVLELAK